jgi:hypothetical protein
MILSPTHGKDGDRLSGIPDWARQSEQIRDVPPWSAAGDAARPRTTTLARLVTSRTEDTMAKMPTVEVRLDTSKVATDVDKLSDEFIDRLARRVLERIRQIEREQGR